MDKKIIYTKCSICGKEFPQNEDGICSDACRDIATAKLVHRMQELRKIRPLYASENNTVETDLKICRSMLNILKKGRSSNGIQQVS